MNPRQRIVLALVPCLVLATAAPSMAQLGALAKRAQQARSLVITEGDEVEIGTQVCEKVRQRYGVVQDPAVHKYVALVGTALSQASSRPSLPWTFIVLDTDGVNAFAAPGGFIHVTRGALALMANEAELAGVLAHEMIHVTGKHTVKAIQKTKAAEIGAQETIKDEKVLGRIVDATTEIVLAGFGRNEELESDREAALLVTKVGYKADGLHDFLGRLAERNKASTEKQGLFASHPEMNERLEKLSKQVGAENLGGTATLEARYRKTITYKPKAQTEIAGVEAGSAGLAGGKASTETKAEEPPKKKRFGGLAALVKPSGSEKKSAEVTGSGASRGVDTERNAKGGSNPALVPVTVKPADLAAFKKEGKLN
jgi:predicted Zn-dependent protease